MPLLDVEFVDFAIEIFDLDEFGIFVDRQDAKSLLVLDAALVESAADFTATLIYSANEVDSG